MAKYQVLILTHFPVGLARLPAEGYAVGNDVAQPDPSWCVRNKMHDMEIPASVRAISRAPAPAPQRSGEENVRTRRAGINAPGANAKQSRSWSSRDAAGRAQPGSGFQIRGRPFRRRARKFQAGGSRQEALRRHRTANRTLGVIGLGAIGSLVADAAIKLAMNVLGYDPDITVEAAWRLPSQVKKAHSVEDVVRNSDFISLHRPAAGDDAQSHQRRAHRHDAAGLILLNFAREGIRGRSGGGRRHCVQADQGLHLRLPQQCAEKTTPP